MAIADFLATIKRYRRRGLQFVRANRAHEAARRAYLRVIGLPGDASASAALDQTRAALDDAERRITRAVRAMVRAAEVFEGADIGDEERVKALEVLNEARSKVEGGLRALGK